MRARRSFSFLVALTLAVACGGSKPSDSIQQQERTAVADPDKTPAGSPEEQVVANLAALRWNELGDPVVRWDAIPAVRASKERPHQLLVVLVEFADRKFERFAGDPKQGDKLASWYQERLFDDGYSQKDTLSHYYATESQGAYHVTGKVIAPVTLPKERAAYGASHRPAGGTWRNDVDPDSMVEESLMLMAKANPDLNWQDFDRWDPADYDGDGAVDEPDGYLDHFVLVFAGGGQSSCQRLNKIDEILTPNVGAEALAKLDPQQRECTDRLWPHRDAMRRREGEGPSVAGTVHPRGGVPLKPDLWAYDYNMQSEYTEASTFIHEFGHSIGLPDVYSRTSFNSTGGWEVMSNTSDPSPQNLSAWSRLQLGWLKPKVVLPPAFGGPAEGSAYLALQDDASAQADKTVMVILPPKKRVIDLTALPASSGHKALYSGQGNEMVRTATLSLNLAKAKKASVALDAWWEIEAGWDFAYVEGSGDGGKSWTRLVPEDRRHMPAKHGHDGKDTRPGLTGLSGDLDGDGKNESNPACDPKAEIKSGEDAAGQEKSKCLDPTWVRVSFSLADFAGKSDVRFRVRYYTDAAAVMRGLLFDNVAVTVDGASAGRYDFESTSDAWKLVGFSPSSGRHDLVVPHYYLIEYRDPYSDPGYDGALVEPSYAFYYDSKGKRMLAMASRPRPGVLAWYFDGAYAWSENDPAINGPGKGYLLAVDGNPNEIAVPGWDQYLVGSAANLDSHYDTSKAQAELKQAFIETVCFVRGMSYLPRGGLPTRNGSCPGRKKKSPAPVSALTIDGKKAMYGYEVVNSYLPGERDDLRKVSELIDSKTTKDGTTYRLRDVGLRYLHTMDAPFWPEPFERSHVVYQVKGKTLAEIASHDEPAQPRFDDRGRWQNAALPFSSVEVPSYGFSFTVARPEGQVPAGAKARVDYAWSTEK